MCPSGAVSAPMKAAQEKGSGRRKGMRHNAVSTSAA
eukprot:CAMPEP_0183449376 /NCGR_PEP_ID=MMETSP0370-20130417/109377_1 /TAXON_ID=268820 /ORGANISM="Peridinium aciculiferum, Strain PAER-2" /LENGTH=35 /DNA_ID= /DNA_START= /DNA_END= /DNA_ORIENTATION=